MRHEMDRPSVTHSVQRHLQEILSNESLRREDREAILAAQLKYLEPSNRSTKGNIDFNICRLFNEDALEFFAQAHKLYAEKDWPMDYQKIPLMISEVAAKMHHVDWKWGLTFCEQHLLNCRFCARPSY